jgi:hypothetical protein
MAQTITCALKLSDEMVSCYKDPAELVLFHDVEMKGHIRKKASADNPQPLRKALCLLLFFNEFPNNH